MRLQDIVFVPSVQHTGTWFTINFLKNFFPRSKELTFLLENDDMKTEDANYLYRPEYLQPLDRPTVVHVHLPIIRNPEHDMDIFGTWFNHTWIQNLSTRRSLPVQVLLLFCNFFKTVIPVRDPMAAILSREARNPQFRHFCIVDGYVALATEFAKHPNVKFLPIDMAESVEKKAELLWNVVSHVGLQPSEHTDLIREVAVSWKPENITPGNRFKQMYYENDLHGLRHTLGQKWAEVEYLRNMSSIILPFMADLGYTRSQLRY